MHMQWNTFKDFLFWSSLISHLFKGKSLQFLEALVVRWDLRSLESFRKTPFSGYCFMLAQLVLIV